MRASCQSAYRKLWAPSSVKMHNPGWVNWQSIRNHNILSVLRPHNGNFWTVRDCQQTTFVMLSRFSPLWPFIIISKEFKFFFYLYAGLILESKGMGEIFQKKGKILENLDKNILNLKIFWKRAGSCIQRSNVMNC